MPVDFKPPSNITDVWSVVRWVQDQFVYLQSVLNGGLNDITLVSTEVEPPRPRDGMIVYAGKSSVSSWDPGSAPGFYGYYGGAWHKLG